MESVGARVFREMTSTNEVIIRAALVLATTLLVSACPAEYDSAAVFHIRLNVRAQDGHAVPDAVISFVDLGPCAGAKPSAWLDIARTDETGRARAVFRHH